MYSIGVFCIAGIIVLVLVYGTTHTEKTIKQSQRIDTMDSDNCNADTMTRSSSNEDNIISIILKSLGIVIFVAGILVGAGMYSDVGDSQINNILATGMIVSGLISCLLFFALGEIINLLHKIAHKEGRKNE